MFEPDVAEELVPLLIEIERPTSRQANVLLFVLVQVRREIHAAFVSLPSHEHHKAMLQYQIHAISLCTFGRMLDTIQREEKGS